MKNNVLYLFVLLGFIFHIQNGYAQNAKKLYKMGSSSSEIGNYEMAIEQYSKAIELNPKYIKAFEARALAYEQLLNYKNAAEDYETLGELIPKNYNNPLKSANLFFKAKEFQRAFNLIDAVEELAPENADIFSLKAKCLFALLKFKEAKEASDKAIKLNNSAENHYVSGLINVELKNYTEAESDFRNSVNLKPDFYDASIQLARLLNILDKQDEALLVLNPVIEKDKKNQKAYVMRGKIYLYKFDSNAAINDFSKAISFGFDSEIHFLRGNAYSQNKKYAEAIDDFSKVIESEKNNLKAYEERAICYQKLNKKAEAVQDYEYIVASIENSSNDQEMLDRCKKNLFELKSENNKPGIFVLNKDNSEATDIEVPEGIDEMNIKIKVLDENDIARVLLGTDLLPVNKDSIKTGQIFKIYFQNKSTIEIIAEDIYQNKTSAIYKIIRKNEGLPKITLINPNTSESGYIYLKSLDPEIIVEGKVSGKNYIDSILINNTPAVFDNSIKDPSFRSRINIGNLQELTFTIKDNQGNKVQKKFPIDRTDAALLTENPMGRTWVVFVENSDYKNFSNLEGPKKEIELMKKALSKYKIDKIIHKRNLTKGQMESFFSYELKNLVIENRVNSLLIWYAGHGKLVGQSGYWIPVDSKIDDVSTYFNINTLKTSIKPYVQNITHSLIVTDACETGPSFYMSMRNLSSERNCADTKSTKFKSSQVFTSSGYDLADGNSKFTSSFANILMFDNNSCVPIERIVVKVTGEVSKSDKLKPKFGKISGFEDENGTFIFIKK